jgi:hypothetical protein
LIVVLTGDRIHDCCKNIPPKLGHMKLAAISMMLGRFVFQNLFRGVDFELGCLIPKNMSSYFTLNFWHKINFLNN